MRHPGIVILPLILMPLTTVAQSLNNEPHCRRYRGCLLSARSDYELCLGGTAAAIVGDYANIKDLDNLLKHSAVVAECENKNFAKIIEYKAIRRIEEDDIIHCTEETETTPISDMRKLACMGTPVTWSLQDLARTVVKKPSQCRELYVYQMERCTFLGGCCPEIQPCMSNITEASLAYQQRIQRSQVINTVTRKCLEAANKKYETLKKPKNETSKPNLPPNFHFSVEKQKKRINEAIEKARAQIGSKENVNVENESKTKNSTIIPTATVPTPPTLPTLPTLPNILHILFPGLTSPAPTTSTVSTTTVPSTTASAIEVVEENTKVVNTDFVKDEAAEVYEGTKRLTETENKKLCHEAIKCESQLRLYKLKCGKKHIAELKAPISHAGFPDLVILQELLEHIEEDNEVAPALRRACMYPLLQNYTESLTSLLTEMDKKHRICTEKSTFFTKTIKPDEKEKCFAISTDMIFEEMAFEEKNSKEYSSDDDYESCVKKIEFATMKCDEAKKCCPGYNVCTKLMLESETSQKYASKMKEIKELQRKCEEDTISSLSSVQPGFSPFFH